MATLAVATAIILPAVPATKASSPTSAAPPGALLASLADPAGTGDDQFGSPEAMSGSTALVGPGRNGSSGAAYIYTAVGGSWPSTPNVSLADPANASGDDFSWSVAVSGPTAVIGAWGTASSRGAAYIYAVSSSGWGTTPVAVLTDPAGIAGDDFGMSVSVSDGTVVVGAIGVNSRAGAAYVYRKTGAKWALTPTLVATELGQNAGDNFGISVAVSGPTVVVGAMGANSSQGAVDIYSETSGGGWPTTATAALADPLATAGDEFGFAVGVAGRAATASAFGANSAAGIVYLFRDSTRGWRTTPILSLVDPKAAAGDTFGYSVALSSTVLVVGAYGTTSGTGAAYMYVKAPTGWSSSPTVTVLPPTAQAAHGFGVAVATSGTAAIFGTVNPYPPSNGAYVYQA